MKKDIFGFDQDYRRINLNTPNVFCSGHQKNYKIKDRCNTQGNSNVPISKENYSIKHKNLKVLPNSKRTIIPSLNKEEENKNKKSLKHKSFSSKNRLSNIKNKSSGLSNNYKNPLINYEAPKQKTQVRESNTFKSTLLNDDLKFIEEDNNIKHFKESEFYLYGTTSQVYSLPGCVKRELPEKVRKNKSNEDSINMKFKSDFSSNVGCLPGSMTKKVDKNFSDLAFHKKTYKDRYNAQESEQINSNSNNNQFRQSKKGNYGMGMYTESNENSMKIKHNFDYYNKDNLYTYFNRNKRELNNKNNPKKFVYKNFTNNTEQYQMPERAEDANLNRPGKKRYIGANYQLKSNFIIQ